MRGGVLISLALLRYLPLLAHHFLKVVQKRAGKTVIILVRILTK